MSRAGSYRTLAAGIASPVAAAAFGALTYSTLTRASDDRDADFVFRLSMTALAMALPFFGTAVLALRDHRRGSLGRSSKIGLSLALLSLALTWLPIRGAIRRANQAELLALENVEAPEFETVDIYGKTHRLSDHRGKVVLVNIWATWCPPCRKEMPELDELYKSRADQGFVVFGLSTEASELQRDFAAEKVSITYPLLTVEGDVPDIYRTTARYPANYLIDRKGLLTPAPSTEQPFERLVEKVDSLLAAPSP
jgi:peroxiredoxin